MWLHTNSWIWYSLINLHFSLWQLIWYKRNKTLHYEENGSIQGTNNMEYFIPYMEDPTYCIQFYSLIHSFHFIAHAIEDSAVFLLIQGPHGKPGTKGPQGVKGGIGPVGLPGPVGDRGEAGSQVWHFSSSFSDSALKWHSRVFILIIQYIYIPLLSQGSAGTDGGPGTDGARGVKVSKEIIISWLY